MCVAGLPTAENLRSFIVSLLIISKPQKVKKMWHSTPSSRAA